MIHEVVPIAFLAAGAFIGFVVGYVLGDERGRR